MKVTGETITDEQIRELRDSIIKRHIVTRVRIPWRDGRVIDCCDLAVGLIARATSLGLMQQTEARTHCANAYNAAIRVRRIL